MLAAVQWETQGYALPLQTCKCTVHCSLDSLQGMFFHRVIYKAELFLMQLNMFWEQHILCHLHFKFGVSLSIEHNRISIRYCRQTTGIFTCCGNILQLHPIMVSRWTNMCKQRTQQLFLLVCLQYELSHLSMFREGGKKERGKKKQASALA